MDIQRLRNLTTGRLHTDMQHIYEDMEWLTGTKGLYTDELPAVLHKLIPYLKAKIDNPRFWDGKHDTTHIGEFAISPMSKTEKVIYHL